MTIISLTSCTHKCFTVTSFTVTFPQSLLFLILMFLKKNMEKQFVEFYWPSGDWWVKHKSCGSPPWTTASEMCKKMCYQGHVSPPMGVLNLQFCPRKLHFFGLQTFRFHFVTSQPIYSSKYHLFSVVFFPCTIHQFPRIGISQGVVLSNCFASIWVRRYTHTHTQGHPCTTKDHTVLIFIPENHHQASALGL